MNRKLKWCNVNTAAASQMLDDVGTGNVYTYTTSNFHITQVTDNHPESLLAKCVGVRVAVSGDPESGNQWMGILPLRVDGVANGKGALELQGDMTVLLFSGGATTPAPSGVAAYHQGFDGQNVPLVRFSGVSCEEATIALRENLVEQKIDLQLADSQLLNTLRFTVEKVRPHLERLAEERAD